MESKTLSERPLKYNKKRWNGDNVYLCAHWVEGSSLLCFVFLLHGSPPHYPFFTYSVAHGLEQPPTLNLGIAGGEKMDLHKPRDHKLSHGIHEKPRDLKDAREMAWHLDII